MATEVRSSILKTCSTCKQTFATLRDLIDHEKTHQAAAVKIENNFHLPIFPGFSKNLRNLPATSKTADDAIPTFTWRCDICSAQLPSSQSYMRHRRMWHGIYSDNYYIKVISDEKKDENKSSIWNWRCDDCSMAFASRLGLSKHYETVHEISKCRKPLACECAKCRGGGATKSKSISKNIDDQEINNRRIDLRDIGDQSSDSQSSDGSTTDDGSSTDDQSSDDQSIDDRNIDRENSDQEIDKQNIGDQSTTTLNERETSRQKKLVGNRLFKRFWRSFRKPPTRNRYLSKLKKERPLPPISAKKLKKRNAETLVGQRLLCKYCLSTYTVSGLPSHQRNYHKTTDGRMLYFCSKCPSIIRPYFTNDAQLLGHIKQEHGDTMAKTSGKKSIKKEKKEEIGKCQNLDNAKDDGPAESAWTTLVKTEPMDDNDSLARVDNSAAFGFAKVKEEPVDNDIE